MLSYLKNADHQSTCDLSFGIKMLGWTSIALGLAELLAPRKVDRILGLRGTAWNRRITQAMGARELAHGVSLLGQRTDSPKQSTALWGRVAGDVVDTALLGVAATKTRRPATFIAISAVVAMIGLMDTYYAKEATKQLG